MQSDQKFKFKDGGWGWCVVVTCAICFGTDIALVNTYSLIYDKFTVVYNSTDNVVTYSAWIGSSSHGFSYITCIFSSLMVDYFDARKVGVAGGLLTTIGLLASGFLNNIKLYFVTYSFALGFGQSLLLASFLSILPHYFDKRLGLANGLMNLGGAFITISLPFVTQASLEKLGLSKTFFILSGLGFINFICAFSFKPQLEKDDKNEPFLRRIKNGLGLEIWKKKRFVIWVLSTFIGNFGYMIPIVTISHHATLNFPDCNPAILSSLLGAFSGISSLIFGRFSDEKKFSVIYFHFSSFLISGILQLTIPFAKQFFELCIIIALLGIVDGWLLSFIVPIGCEIAESPLLANQAIGYFFTVIAIPEICGPTVAGILYENYLTYKYAYFVGGGTCIASSILLILFYPDAIVNKIFKVIDELQLK